MIKFILNNIPRKTLQKFAGTLVPLSSIFYYGNKIECSICGKHFGKLMNYGYVNIRKNALCPFCLSLERHRMMWYYLKNETDFFKSKIKVLHVAPESPFIKRFDKIISKNGGEYITADLESPLAKVKMNVENIPFSDNYFDVIICNHVLEHVNDDQKALREIYRTLKSGGYSILLSPIDYSREFSYEDKTIINENDRLKHFGQKDHLRIYGRDYSSKLSSTGFVVKEINYSQLMDVEQASRLAFSTETLYITTK